MTASGGTPLARRRRAGGHARGAMSCAIRSGPLARSPAGWPRTPVPATARRAIDHLVRRAFPLRLSTPIAPLVRWTGRVRRHPLDRPGEPAAPRARGAALSPAGRPRVPGQSPRRSHRSSATARSRRRSGTERPPRVEFTFERARSPAERRWRDAEHAVSIDPGAQLDRPPLASVTIPLPPTAEPALDVHVSLSTRVAAGASVGNAWALFGEPRFEWRRRPERSPQLDPDLRAAVCARRPSQLRSSSCARPASPTHDAEAYARWVARHTPDEAALAALARDVAALPLQPLISIVTPVYNTDPRWLRACIDSVRRQAYPHWELCLCDDASSTPETIQTLREYESDPRIRVRYLSVNAGISAASNAALAMARGEFVALLDHDDELTPDALAEVVAHLNAQPDADVIYSDEDKLDLAGARCDPYFKPDWSPEHFLSCMYTCHLMVVRRTADRGGRRVPERLRRRAGLRPAAAHDGAHERRASHSAHPLSLAEAAESTASAGQAKPWALDAGRLALEDYVRRSALDAEVLPGGAPGVYRVRRTHSRDAARVPRHSDGRQAQNRRREHRSTSLAQAIRSVVAEDDLRQLRVRPGPQRDRTPADAARQRRCARSRARAIPSSRSSAWACSTSRPASTPAPRAAPASTSCSSTTTSRSSRPSG